MRRNTRRGGIATMAIERLRALFDPARFDPAGLDGSPALPRPPVSFGGSPAATARSVPWAPHPSSPPPSHPSHRPSHRAPPAAISRSSPRPPDDQLEDGPDALEPMPPPAIGEGLVGRLDPGLPGARALAAVAVLAALVGGGYLWLSRPRPQPVSDAGAVPSLAAPARSASPAPTATVVVHVAGKVRHPGVVTLAAGARVSDAVEAAGGLRPGAAIGSLNLARKVLDGEQILVGISAAPGPQAPVGATAGGVAPLVTPGMPLDLNAATVEQFQQLPGVGPVLAQRIVDYRTRNGAFHSVEQLREVTGIGARRFDDLKDLVRV